MSTRVTHFIVSSWSETLGEYSFRVAVHRRRIEQSGALCQRSRDHVVCVLFCGRSPHVEGTRALTNPAAAAQLSTLDLQRADAAAMFGLRLDALNQASAKTAGDLEKYDRACRGKMTVGRATGIAVNAWKGFWLAQRIEIANESTPACRMLVTEIKTQSQQITHEMERIDEDARRRGIYPGVMRDLKRMYGFN